MKRSLWAGLFLSIGVGFALGQDDPLPESSRSEVGDAAPAASEPVPEGTGASVPVPVESSSSFDDLREVAAAMERAAAGLDAGRLETTTIDQQQAAIDRLRTLLKSAAQQKSKSSASASPHQGSPDTPPAGDSESTGQPAGDSGRRADDPEASNSSENVSAPLATGANTLTSGGRATAVWGHLPQREQEAVMRTLTDSILPEYAAQIEEYYKAIAEGR